jgi:glutamate carboxypeptidase
MSPLSAEQLRAIVDRARAQLDSTLPTIKQLVEIESPSGYESGSQAAAAFLQDFVASTGLHCEIKRIPVQGYGQHLRLHFPGGKGVEKPVLLIGHTDTVHEIGSLNERPWRVEGGKAYGPGVFDMKANCIVAIDAVKAIHETAGMLTTPVVLLLTCDEETGSITGKALVEEEARRARAALVLEPPAPGGVVKTGRKGTGMFWIEAKGIAAHAGLDPEKGASAVLEMARQIARLHALTDFAKGTTVNVGVVHGGTRSNVVAEDAKAEVDIRFTSMAEARRVEEVIRGLEPFNPRVRLIVRGTINRPPMERNKTTEALFARAAEIARCFDFELRETQVGGASDGNFAAAVGANVLDGLGVDGDGAHAAHEHIVIEDIPRRTALLAGLISSV